MQKLRIPISPILRIYLKMLVFSIVLGVAFEAFILILINLYPTNQSDSSGIGIFLISSIAVVVMTVRGNLARFYFEEKGEEKNQIKKFQYSQRIVYITTPMLVILFLISYTQQIALIVNDDLKRIGGIGFITTLQVILILFFMQNLLYFLPAFVTKEFWFNFAKACIKVVQKEEREVDKTAYLFLGLGMYDKYLRKTLNFRIRDLEKIFDKILCLPIEGKYVLIASISNALEGEKLDLAKQLSKRYLPEQNTDQFLIKEKIGQKIKDATALIIPIITIAVTIIGLIIKK
jgi:hypothetical protein